MKTINCAIAASIMFLAFGFAVTGQTSLYFENDKPLYYEFITNH